MRISSQTNAPFCGEHVARGRLALDYYGIIRVFIDNEKVSSQPGSYSSMSQPRILASACWIDINEIAGRSYAVRAEVLGRYKVS